MPQAVQSIEVNVTPDAFFDVITDFESYPSFLSEVRSCRLVSDDGGCLEVDYVVQVIKRFEYTLRFEAERATSLSWQLKGSSFIKRNEGSWTLEPLDDGTGTKATYRVLVETSLFVPRAVATKLLEVTLPATLSASKREAERRQGNS